MHRHRNRHDHTQNVVHISHSWTHDACLVRCGLHRSTIYCIQCKCENLYFMNGDYDQNRFSLHMFNNICFWNAMNTQLPPSIPPSSRPQFKCVRIRNKAQCYVNFSLKHSTTAASSAEAADQTLLKVRECEIPSSDIHQCHSHNSINLTSDFPQTQQQPSTSTRPFIPNNIHHIHWVSSKVTLNSFFFLFWRFTKLKQKTEN